MEANVVDDWFELAIENSLSVPNRTEVDRQKANIDLNAPPRKATEEDHLVPFRVAIRFIELLPSSLSSVMIYISKRIFILRIKNVYLFSPLLHHTSFNLLQHSLTLYMDDSTGRHGQVHGTKQKDHLLVQLLSNSMRYYD